MSYDEYHSSQQHPGHRPGPHPPRTPRGPRGPHGARQGGGGVPDGLLVGVLGLLLGLTVFTWTATGLAGLFSRGAWPDGVTFAQTPMAMRELVTEPHDLAGAWPSTPTAQLPPGYGLFWGIFIGQLLVLTVLTVFVLSTISRARAVRAARRAGVDLDRAPDQEPAPEPTGGPKMGPTRPEEGPPMQRTPHGQAPMKQGPLGQRPLGGTGSSSPARAEKGNTDDPTAPQQPLPPDSSGPEPSSGGPAPERAPSAAQHPHPVGGAPTDAATNAGAPSAHTPVPDGHDPTPGIGRPETSSQGAPAPATPGTPLAYPAAPVGPAAAAQRPSSARNLAAEVSGPTGDPLTRVAEAPGAALVVTRTATLWADTKDSRAKLGPVHLFDPTHQCDTPARLRWSPHQDCADRDTAAQRATALLEPLRSPRPIDAEVHTAAVTLLRCWLHAAALDDRTFREVHRWALSKSAPSDPVQTLRTNPAAAAGAAGELESVLTGHPERRHAATELIRRALTPLSQLHVRNALTGARTDRISLESFINETGTLYVVGDDPDIMPVLNALTQSVVEHGRRMAARSSPGRLDPPLTTVLDLDPATALAAEADT